jgi:hypothetical protein
VSGGAGALLFSQCNVAWRSFLWAGVQGFRVLFLLFDFFFLPSVAPPGKYSVWSAEGLPRTLGAGGWQAGRWRSVCWWAGGRAAAWWADGRGMGLTVRLFFQSIMAWRSLPLAGGSQC